MKDLEETANQLEMIQKRVMACSHELQPSPERYFMIYNKKKDCHWILGFLFKTKEELRLALENGACYQIHDFVLKSVSGSENLGDISSYIVFEFGNSPETDAEHEKLHDKYLGQLDALHREHANKSFDECKLCGHSADDHLIKGFTEDGESGPTKGWMICPNEDCTCFRTWSLGGE